MTEKRKLNISVKLKDLIPSELELADLELTTEEILFVGYVCAEGFHRPGEAYLKSHSRSMTNQELSDAQLRSRGIQLLGKANVREAIQRFIKHTLEPFKEQFEMQQFQFWQARAYWNPLDVFDSDGSVKEISKIPKHALLAIDGIKKDYRGKDATQAIITYDMASRSEAMKQLQDFVKVGAPPKKIEENVNTQDRVRMLLDEGKKALTSKKRTSVERVTERVVLDEEPNDDNTERDVTNDGKETQSD
jgi:hypothetical protein